MRTIISCPNNAVYTLSIFVLALNFSCNNNDQKDAPLVHKAFQSDTVFIDNFFPPFVSDDIPGVLEQLGLCTTVDSLVGKPKSICSPELFRTFALGEDVPFQEGFIVDTKIGVLANSTTSKALLVFYNISGKMEMTNFLKGRLLEMRTTPDGYFDIVMKYRHPEIGDYITVRHEWRHNSRTFIPVDVEEINDHFVIPEFKDSINHVYLDDFSWGY